MTIKKEVSIRIEDIAEQAITLFEYGKSASRIPKGMRQVLIDNVTPEMCFGLGVDVSFIQWLKACLSSPLLPQERAALHIAFGRTLKENNIRFTGVGSESNPCKLLMPNAPHHVAKMEECLMQEGLSKERAAELVQCFCIQF